MLQIIDISLDLHLHLEVNALHIKYENGNLNSVLREITSNENDMLIQVAPNMMMLYIFI